MRRIYAGSLLFLWIFALAIASAQADGKIVFTKSEFRFEGFRKDVLKNAVGRRAGWWELYRRNICVINSDGTGLEQLTDNDVSYRAQWSPDGQKIAFLSSPPPRVTLQVMDSDGSSKKELVPNQEDIYDFKWSPDGTKILAFIKSRMPREPEEAWIVTVSSGLTDRMGRSEWARGWNHWAPEGATILNPNRRLIDGLPDGIAWPEWSPDNNYIAFIHEKRLVIADVMVTGMPEEWRPSNYEPPCQRIGDWSPDGSKLLFFVSDDVCSINFDETGVMNLSMSKAEDACWSPDGSQIAFTSTDGRKRNTEIFIMNADGTGHTQLTNTNYFHMDLDWK